MLNLKWQADQKKAEKVLLALKEPGVFFQNKTVDHRHQNRVRKIRFSKDGSIVTLSSDCCKVWKVGQKVTEAIMIPFEDAGNDHLDNDCFHLSISDDGNTVVVLRGTQNLEVFQVNVEG